MPTTVIPRVETVEALNFGDFSIYPDSQGRYSIHREQIRALLLQLSGESKAHAEVKAANVKLNEENAALAKQSADLSAAVAQMTEAAEETFSYCDLKDRLADAVSERNRLKQRVAEMTSGKPAAWLVRGQYGYCYRDTEEQARATYQDATLIPLFLANGGPEAAELAAKVEALGIELAREKRMREETRLDLVKAQEERGQALARAKVAEESVAFRAKEDACKLATEKACGDALRARVDALTAGEHLTKAALAAAEKDRDRAQRDAREWEEQTQREQASAARAEARIKALESSAEPFAWVAVRDDQPTKEDHFFLDEAEARKDAWQDNYRVEPLYRHPPKPAAETKHYPAWETSGGPNECPHGYAAGIPCQRCDVAKAKPAGEPVAWANRQNGRLTSICFDGPGALGRDARWPIPLYEAPPPAAIGVTDERFAVLKSFDDADIIAADGGASDHFLTVARDPRSDTDPAFADGNASPWVRSVGSLDECRRAMDRDGEEQPNSIVRIVPINAPTVDIAAIRKALSPDRHWVPTLVRAEILAAIGEKGG